MRLLFYLLYCLYLGETGSLRTKRYAQVPIFRCRAPDYYACANTVFCIHGLYRCDGERDCPGTDDEEGCFDYECPEGTLKCSDTGQCISKRKLCDGCMDCRNGDDERNCTHIGPCLGSQYKCSGIGNCIPVDWTCNLEKDCAGADDENCNMMDQGTVELTNEMPEYILDVKRTRDRFTENMGFQTRILLEKWHIKGIYGQHTYVRPQNVSLGTQCGPSIITIRDAGSKVAELCGNSFPPWKGSQVASTAGEFEVELRFFNDYEEEDERSFTLMFWSSEL